MGILVEGTRGSFRWGILVEGARGSFRWEILVEGARGSSSRSASAVSKSSLLFVRAEIGTDCRNSHWNIRETGSLSSSDRRHPVPAQLFRHLPSSGSSANAEHSWLEHPTPHGTSFSVRSRSAEELPQIFCFLKNGSFVNAEHS